MASDKRFSFGENWSRYLAEVDTDRVRQSADKLRELVGDLHGKSFLDVGCGSGIHSLAALTLGAQYVVSFDYDDASVKAAEQLRLCAQASNWIIQQGSVLDPDYLRSLGKFDVVYSWGALHHTGDMWRALDLVTIPCKEVLAIAIYNDQGIPTSFWKTLKRSYVHSGRVMRQLLEFATFAIIWGGSLAYHAAKLKPWAPFEKWRNYGRERGMSPWIDIVDWAGIHTKPRNPRISFRFFRIVAFACNHPSSRSVWETTNSASLGATIVRSQ